MVGRAGGSTRAKRGQMASNPFYNPKSVYTLCVALAACIRQTAALTDAVRALQQQAHDAGTAVSFPLGKVPVLSESMCVLLTHITLAAERIAVTNKSVQSLCEQLAYLDAREDVSRETLPPDTERTASRWHTEAEGDATGAGGDQT